MNSSPKAAAAAATKGPSLLPREHGAYAELAFPLVTGLSLAQPSLAALALAGAAVAFFLVHEPLAILLGLRGQRLKEHFSRRAPPRVASLLVAALILAALSWRMSEGRIWPSVLLPLVPVAVLIPLVLSGRQKTLAGEVLAIAAFSGLVLPLAAACGADAARAGWAAAVWWGSFTLGTLEVHAIKARHKDTGRSRWTLWGSPLASASVVGLCLVGVFMLREEVGSPALALLFPAASILILGFLRIHPRRLIRVGWTLVAANLVALSILQVQPLG